MLPKKSDSICEINPRSLGLNALPFPASLFEVAKHNRVDGYSFFHEILSVQIAKYHLQAFPFPQLGLLLSHQAFTNSLLSLQDTVSLDPVEDSIVIGLSIPDSLKRSV